MKPQHWKKSNQWHEFPLDKKWILTKSCRNESSTGFQRQKSIGSWLQRQTVLVFCKGQHFISQEKAKKKKKKKKKKKYK